MAPRKWRRHQVQPLFNVQTIEERLTTSFQLETKPEPFANEDSVETKPETPRPLKIKARCDDAEGKVLPEYITSDGEKWIIIEMKGCDRGPPLLLAGGRWVSSMDGACSNLSTFLDALAKQAGETCLPRDTVDGKHLPRYQCAVPYDEWRSLWTAVREQFISMRSAYRYLRGGKNAPSLWFGLNPRFVEEGSSNMNSATPLYYKFTGGPASLSGNSPDTAPVFGANPFSEVGMDWKDTSYTTPGAYAAYALPGQSPLTPIPLQCRAGFVHYRSEAVVSVRRSHSCPPTPSSATSASRRA
jgi:hypothetical protein